MNLIIDIGNSYIKIACFENNEITNLKIYKKLSLNTLINFTKNNPEIKSAIVSSVAKYPESIKKYLSDNYNFVELNNTTPLPIINKYKTPETLGNDRIAAVVGAISLFPNKDILVIDAGTCITYDFINSEKEYFGGSISPGLKLRFKSLHNFTDKLPLINDAIDYEVKLTGNSTKACIISGVVNGIILEIDGMINLYKKKYPEIITILCGGDSIYFDKMLKNSIFANSNIVLSGLNIILNFYEKK
ncbi:MAG: type III pantothenate kinase [Bacteroidales bacterium]|nr:type III pantothenate kinase [Bacteroidales bacterium]